MTGEQRDPNPRRRILQVTAAGEVSALGTDGIDLPMIKTLGKAFYWQQLLDDGVYPSSNALARAMKLESGWVADCCG